MYIDEFIVQLIFTAIVIAIVVVLCYGVAQISYKTRRINPLKKWYGKQKKQKKKYVRRSRYIPSSVKQKVWERDRGKCVQCGSQIDLEYDHDIPFSKGGSNSVDNVRLLCRKCNRSKSAKIQ
ncbi:MAG: HNH endonuclease [Spirochaetaceae bacterium]|jgi:5-methylcytosine-specific restriction endonuclease McrA|nr:HNH endonuclease [Spirochaetaceae bacterium]